MSDNTTNVAHPAISPDVDWMPVTQCYFDPESDVELSNALVKAIADTKDVAPSEVSEPPLYEVVDAAALERALFESGGSGIFQRDGGTFEFRYSDLLVKVRNDGWIQVYETREE